MFLHHFTDIYDIFAPFLPLIKQKKRKPEPAVKEHFRKFPFFFYLTVIKPSGSTVNSGLSAIVPSGLR